MKSENMLLVPKMSKVERDLHRLRYNKKQLKNLYEKENLDSEKIFESHRKQKENLEKVKEIIGNIDIVSRSDLTRELVNKYKLIIAFGGDNHFLFVTHFLDRAPIIGINSDPERSDGALNTGSLQDLKKISERKIEDINYKNWDRLKVSVDGDEIIANSTSEIYIGEEKRYEMSRHIVKLGRKSEEQKGSGIIVSTGVGSTGWYGAASKYLFTKEGNFQKNSREARFILTEPHRPESYELKHGKIKENESLELIALSDSNPCISIDSLEKINIKEGSKVIISIGRPLKVISMN